MQLEIHTLPGCLLRTVYDGWMQIPPSHPPRTRSCAAGTSGPTARTGAEPSASPPWSVFCRFLTESVVVQGRGAGSDPSHGRPGVRMLSTPRSGFVMNHDGVLRGRPVTPPRPTRPPRRIASSQLLAQPKPPLVEDSEFPSVVDCQEPHQSQRNMPSRHWGSRPAWNGVVQSLAASFLGVTTARTGQDSGVAAPRRQTSWSSRRVRRHE